MAKRAVPKDEAFVAMWPRVPKELRPKNLYVDRLMDAADKQMLERRGWRIVDIRLMETRTDGDRAEAVKVYLEGIRVGSIEPTHGLVKHLELEAKIYGLLSNKNQETYSKPKIDDTILESLLDIGSNKVTKMKDQDYAEVDPGRLPEKY